MKKSEQWYKEQADWLQNVFLYHFIFVLIMFLVIMTIASLLIHIPLEFSDQIKGELDKNAYTNFINLSAQELSNLNSTEQQQYLKTMLGNLANEKSHLLVELANLQEQFKIIDYRPELRIVYMSFQMLAIALILIYYCLIITINIYYKKAKEDYVYFDSSTIWLFVYTLCFIAIFLTYCSVLWANGVSNLFSVHSNYRIGTRTDGDKIASLISKIKLIEEKEIWLANRTV